MSNIETPQSRDVGDFCVSNLQPTRTHISPIDGNDPNSEFGLRCTGCLNFYPEENYLEHFNSCPNVASPCPKGCGEVITRKNRSEHLSRCQSKNNEFISSGIELFNMEGVDDEILHDWLQLLDFDYGIFKAIPQENNRIWLVSIRTPRQYSAAIPGEVDIVQDLKKTLIQKNFPFVRDPLNANDVPEYEFCPPLSYIDCPFHPNWFAGRCPFRHRPFPNQMCRYWKIGRFCSGGINCHDKHPPLRLVSLNFHSMALGRCKWCGDPDPTHPAWECEQAPYNDQIEANTSIPPDQSNDQLEPLGQSGLILPDDMDDEALQASPAVQPSGESSISNTLVKMLAELLALEPTHSKHITSLGSFLYQRYPNAKAILQQTGMKLKAFIRRFPHVFRYDAETCLVFLITSHQSSPFAAPGSSNTPIVCRWFLQGTCKKGVRCPYVHDSSQRPKRVCDFFRRNGRCAWGDECKWSHDIDLSESDTSSDVDVDKKGYPSPRFISNGYPFMSGEIDPDPKHTLITMLPNLSSLHGMGSSQSPATSPRSTTSILSSYSDPWNEKLSPHQQRKSSSSSLTSSTGHLKSPKAVRAHPLSPIHSSNGVWGPLTSADLPISPATTSTYLSTSGGSYPQPVLVNSLNNKPSSRIWQSAPLQSTYVDQAQSEPGRNDQSTFYYPHDEDVIRPPGGRHYSLGDIDQQPVFSPLPTPIHRQSVPDIRTTFDVQSIQVQRAGGVVSGGLLPNFRTSTESESKYPKF